MTVSLSPQITHKLAYPLCNNLAKTLATREMGVMAWQHHDDQTPLDRCPYQPKPANKTTHTHKNTFRATPQHYILLQQALKDEQIQHERILRQAMTLFGTSSRTLA